MEPEVEERFQRTERNIAELTGIVLSLGRSVSEHDEVISSLARSASEHDHRLDQLTEAVSQLVIVVSEDRVAMKELREELRETQSKTDEELGILIRMMEEWIRSNRHDGQQQ